MNRPHVPVCQSNFTKYPNVYKLRNLSLQPKIYITRRKSYNQGLHMTAAPKRRDDRQRARDWLTLLYSRERERVSIYIQPFLNCTDPLYNTRIDIANNILIFICTCTEHVYIYLSSSRRRRSLIFNVMYTAKGGRTPAHTVEDVVDGGTSAASEPGRWEYRGTKKKIT